MYINKNISIRLEFYGGLIFCKKTLEKWEVTKEDSIFLLAIRETNDLKQSIKVVNDVFSVEYTPNLKDFIDENIIIDNNDISNSIVNNRLDELICKYKNLVIESNTRKNLKSPLELTIYPSLKCQLECKFCFLHDRNGQDSHISNWEKVIRDAKEIGVMSISILGGEPSLYPNIIELIDIIEKYRVKSTITTNGINLSSEFKDKILSSEHITPVFSIQSLDDLNYKLMGSSYIDVVKNLEYFSNRNKKCRVNTVYTQQSYKQIYDIVDLCSELEVERYSVAYCFPNLNMNIDKTFNDNRNLYESVNDYMESKGIVLDFSNDGCMLFTSYEDIDDELIETPLDKFLYGCACGKSKLEILPDGSAYPCISFQGTDFKCLNVFEKGLQYVWDNDSNLNALRTYKTSVDECKVCNIKKICNGGCPALNYKNHKDIKNIKDSRCSRSLVF